jgi:predicted porin
MNKKSLLAIAIASAAFSSVATAAPSVDVYGFVDIGLEQINESGLSNGADIFAGGFSPNGNSDEQEFALANNVQSRIGIKGGEDIEDGWKGTYRMEFTANVLESGGDALKTRLGWLGLENGEHSFKIGTQWSPFMSYSAWNTNRGESHGLGSYFYITDELKGSMAYGFRNSSMISYTYGSGGWGTASPVTATVALHVGDDDRKTFEYTAASGGNSAVFESTDELTSDAGITGITVAGATTLGNVTLNAVYVQNLVVESSAAKAQIAAATDAVELAAAKDLVTEPAIFGAGAKMQVSKDLELGFAYRGADRDTEENDYTYTTSVSSQYQLNEKTNIHLGIGQGEDDDATARQLKLNFYGQVWYQASESRSVRFEFEHVDYGDDGEALVTLVSMRQAF